MLSADAHIEKNSNKVEYCIDEITPHKLCGWAFIEKRDSAFSEIYIRVSDNNVDTFYRPYSVASGDVATHFGNDNYLNCRFELYVPKIDLTYAIQLSLILINGEEMYETELPR
jgi:hypothetical protein